MIAAHSMDPVTAALEAHLYAARQDPVAFASYVLRDERTGRPVELAPMHCEWHDLFDREHRLVLWSHIESGKTQTLVGRVLWALGTDPATRVGLVSNTATQAEKLLRSVARYIEGSTELGQVFPHLRPADQWTTTAITVQRPVVSKDPSVQAFGVHGAVLGARLDLLILDDVLDYENCRTADQRQQLAEWYAASCAGRLTEGGRVVVAGVAYHPDDLLHRLASQSGWTAARFTITDDSDRPRWPQRWSTERIEKKRAELGPLEAARQLDCLARSEADARFKQEWIQTALDRGQNKKVVPHLINLGGTYRTVTGVDLAVSAKSSADLTVFFTILVHPNGGREVLNIESGRWAGPEIVERIMRLHHRFQSTVVVESNAAQAYIAQMVRRLSAVPVVPYMTGRGQASLEWQCEALATEMANGKWSLPSGPDARPIGEVAALVRDLLYYDPRSHCPDRVAAACFARWGAQQGEQRVSTFNLDVLSR